MARHCDNNSCSTDQTQKSVSPLPSPISEVLHYRSLKLSEFHPHSPNKLCHSDWPVCRKGSRGRKTQQRKVRCDSLTVKGDRKTIQARVRILKTEQSGVVLVHGQAVWTLWGDHELHDMVSVDHTLSLKLWEPWIIQKKKKVNLFSTISLRIYCTKKKVYIEQ